MIRGLFEVGDRVDHKTTGYAGTVTAIPADGFVLTTSSFTPHAADDLVLVNEKKIQDAFELGFKAAGGSIAPDVVGGGPWKIVEIAMDRDEIDAVGRVVEAAIKRAGGVRTHAALTSFLDKISIFRRK